MNRIFSYQRFHFATVDGCITRLNVSIPSKPGCWHSPIQSSSRRSQDKHQKQLIYLTGDLSSLTAE